MTIPGRGDLMPSRRHGRRSRRGGRRVLGVLVVVVVLAAAGYGVWFQWFRTTTSAGHDVHLGSCHTVTRAVAPANPGQVRVKVLNTTSKSGLAASTRRALVQRGFVSAGVGNATPQLGGAVIRYPRGTAGLAAAEAVAEQVPGVSLKPVSGMRPVELDLGKGWHGLDSKAQAGKARAKAETAAKPVKECAQ